MGMLESELGVDEIRFVFLCFKIFIIKSYKKRKEKKLYKVLKYV